MNDLISRQRLLEYIHGEPVGRLLCDKYNLDGLIEQLPPASNSEIPNSSDTISRQQATDALRKMQTYKLFSGDDMLLIDQAGAQTELMLLPSAQPEIIRCKDCKYQDENWRRVSVRWLPCMDVRTGSNWYCGSAERGEQDE